MRKITTFSTLTAVFATTAVIGTATLANADSLKRSCTSAPQTEWLALDALLVKVEALGYKVQKAKLKASCGEFEAIDKNGGRVKLSVDPTSGAVVTR